MSSAVKGVVKTLNPIDHVKNTVKNWQEGNYLQAVLDPGDAFGPANPEDAPGMSESDVIQDDPRSMAESAAEEAKRKGRKKKETTQTVLTSPLGATKDAKTAITKLGGS